MKWEGSPNTGGWRREGKENEGLAPEIENDQKATFQLKKNEGLGREKTMTN